MSRVEDQLRHYACQGAILEAASIYTAELDRTIDYDGFLFIGADEDLVMPDEVTPVSPKARIEWRKWKWLRWASSPSDLTFVGCIRFILDDIDNEDKEDCATLEEVLAVLRGKQF